MTSLEAELVLDLYVDCIDNIEIGNSLDGVLRVIPIVGGIVDGKIKGNVVSGGADWNTSKKDDVSHVFAKYVIKTDDGEYVSIENEGVIDNKSKDTVIKTSPKFIANENSKYHWLNYGVYVGSLDSGLRENQVHIKIYKLM